MVDTDADQPQINEYYLGDDDITYNEKNEKVICGVTTIKEKLGVGGFSKVFKVERKFTWEEEGKIREESFPYAMKIIDKRYLSKKYNFSADGDNKSYLDVAMQEIEIFKRIRHQGIIKVFEVIHSEEKVYLLMQLANIGTVLDWNPQLKTYEMVPKTQEYLEKNSLALFKKEKINWDNLGDREVVAKRIFYPLCGAVAAMHSKNIVHRDIKWENIIARSEDSDFEVRFIDFSVGVILESPDQKLIQFEGTPEYQAPEVVGEPYDPKKAEVWTLGCCLYSFMWGTLPKMSTTPYQEVIEKVEGISEDLKELLNGMLNENPEERLSSSDLESSLWFLS